ncbi:hypothetical protein [Spongiibacter sp.]|uniref:hypothetical protein n=1 Tax=Spongiibacter sp. TaxID=2024860 RepID=UPI0035625110
MSRLHILQTSDSLQRALPCIAPGDTLIFFPEALAASASDTPRHDVIQYRLDDGSGKSSTLPSIDYSRFVSLCSEHSHCLSW